MNALFTPTRIGRYTVRNRLVMAPMTRSRADNDSGVPSVLATTYYGQRANAGLIITEGTQPSAMGKGYVRTPGIHTEEQMQAWQTVTAEVHRQGGRIFLQLMHTGRISHPSLLPDHATPLAPSAIQAAGQVFTASGPQDMMMPRAVQTHEIADIINDFRLATRNALRAGFDGVELHAASGYLPEQFLSSSTNVRTDQYGGSLENRSRFILEVLAAMTDEAGGDRVGIKIAPEMNFNDIRDAHPQETYRYLVEQLAPLNLAYLHVALYQGEFDYHGMLRPLFNGAYLQGSGLNQASSEKLIADGRADAAVFGSLYLANPDLLQRFEQNAPLNAAKRESFFSDGPQGYIDYPFLPPQDVNHALRIHAYGGAKHAQIEQIDVPRAGPGEVLVRVHAAGVNSLDWKIRDGLVQDAFPLALPATLGIELAGEVVALGEGVERFTLGSRVMGALGAIGAYAEQVVVAADKLVRIPDGVDDIHAAAMPVAVLTAWQALFEAGQLQAGQTVLIHGAAGGVGSFAVQLARRAGARVIATAQGVNAGYLRGLGADTVIDYRQSAFWEHVSQVDLVLDLVGGTTLANSWQVLADHGRIVSTAAPEIMATAPAGKQASWFQMRIDTNQLAQLANLVAKGELKNEVSEVADLSEAGAVIERNKTGHGPGKAVISFTR